MLPAIMLIEAPVDGEEIYRIASQPLRLTEKHQRKAGDRSHLLGLTMIHPSEDDTADQEGNDLAIWINEQGEVRWNLETWKSHFSELYPMFPLGAVVILENAGLTRYPEEQAAAIQAMAEYCEAKGLNYWWTSKAPGFGWEIGDELWMNHTRFLGLLKDPEFPIS